MVSALFQPFERGSAFKNLSALLQSDHPPLALIGSGASMNSGYPSWKVLVDELGEQAGAKALIPQRAQALAEDLVWAAEAHRRDIPKGRFKAFIENRFGPPSDLQEPLSHLEQNAFPPFLDDKL